MRRKAQDVEIGGSWSSVREQSRSCRRLVPDSLPTSASSFDRCLVSRFRPPPSSSSYSSFPRRQWMPAFVKSSLRRPWNVSRVDDYIDFSSLFTLTRTTCIRTYVHASPLRVTTTNLPCSFVPSPRCRVVRLPVRRKSPRESVSAIFSCCVGLVLLEILEKISSFPKISKVNNCFIYSRF